MFEFFQKGGVLMYPLLACSIISLAVIVERLYFYSRLSRHHGTTDLMDEIKRKITQHRVSEAIAICEADPFPLAKVIREGLLRFEKGWAVMQDSMEEAGQEIVPQLERFLPILALLTSVSPLLGFTGTVFGMIEAFNSIAQANISSPAIVASGIAQALITTAAGLVIAIPTMIFYHYFRRRVDSFVSEIEKNSTALVNLIKYGELR